MEVEEEERTVLLAPFLAQHAVHDADFARLLLVERAGHLEAVHLHGASDLVDHLPAVQNQSLDLSLRSTGTPSYVRSNGSSGVRSRLT